MLAWNVQQKRSEKVTISSHSSSFLGPSSVAVDCSPFMTVVLPWLWSIQDSGPFMAVVYSWQRSSRDFGPLVSSQDSHGAFPHKKTLTRRALSQNSLLNLAILSRTLVQHTESSSPFLALRNLTYSSKHHIHKRQLIAPRTKKYEIIGISQQWNIVVEYEVIYTKC